MKTLLNMSLTNFKLTHNQEDGINTEVNIYPNSVSEFITLKKDPQVEVERVSILNLNGQIVLLSKQDRFNISKLNTGFYTAKIETNYGISYKKLIIN